MLIIGQLIMGY